MILVKHFTQHWKSFIVTILSYTVPLTTKVVKNPLLNNIFNWLLSCHYFSNLIMVASDDAMWCKWSLNWSLDTNNVSPPDINVALIRYKSSNTLGAYWIMCLHTYDCISVCTVRCIIYVRNRCEQIYSIHLATYVAGMIL